MNCIEPWRARLARPISFLDTTSRRALFRTLALLALAFLASPAMPQKATGPESTVPRSYWHLVSVLPTSAGQSVDLWVHLATLELGQTSTEYLPALVLEPGGTEPDMPKLRTKWTSHGGALQHEVETPRKANESDEAFAKRHAGYVAAALTQFPPDPPPGTGG